MPGNIAGFQRTKGLIATLAVEKERDASLRLIAHCLAFTIRAESALRVYRKSAVFFEMDIDMRT